MFKIKFIFLIFYIISTFFFLFVKSTYDPSLYQDYVNLCKDFNYTESLQKYILNITEVEGIVINSDILNSTASSPFLISYMQHGDSSDLVSYTTKGPIKFAFFLILAGITFISLLIFFKCCNSPSCGCQTKSTEKRKNIYYLIANICAILSIIACAVGVHFSMAFVDSLENISCPSLNFYFNLRNGKNTSDLNTTYIQKWLGIDNILSILNSTTQDITQISENYSDVFESAGLSTLQDSVINFETTLNDLYKSNYKNTLVNRNPAASKRNNENTITPYYIQNLGNYTKNGTYLYQIYSEYQKNLDPYYQTIEKINISSIGIMDNFNSIKSIFNTVNSTLSNLKETLDAIAERVLKPLININKSIKNGKYLLVGFITLIILFQILNIIFLYFFYKKKRLLYRYGSHVMWILITILTILSFLLGSGVGSMGVVLSDLIPALNFIFSGENLLGDKLLINDKQAAEVINICLHYGGDLGNEMFGIEFSDVDLINQFYLNSANLTKFEKSNIILTSSEVENVKSEFEAFSQDISLIIKDNSDPNSPANLINEMRRWSDESVTNTYQKSCGQTLSKDMWVQSKGKCANGYTYSGENSNTIGPSTCLLWGEWAESAVSSRYSSLSSPNCANSNPDFTNIQSAVISYFDSFNQLTSDVSNQIATLTNGLQNLNSEYSTIAQNIKNSLTSIKSYYSPIYLTLYPVIGDKRFNTLINCGFLKEDLFSIYVNLKDKVSPQSIIFASLLIAVSIFNYFSIIFLLITIIKNLPKKSKFNILNEEGTKFIEEESNKKEENKMEQVFGDDYNKKIEAVEAFNKPANPAEEANKKTKAVIELKVEVK